MITFIDYDKGKLTFRVILKKISFYNKTPAEKQSKDKDFHWFSFHVSPFIFILKSKSFMDSS